MSKVDVIMPQMGESIAEGTLTRWLKNVGDPVERDEDLFEISTDKVDADIPSPAGGVLAEVLVQSGETVEINTVVARIETDATVATSAAPSAPAAEPPLDPPAKAMEAGPVTSAAPAAIPAAPPADATPVFPGSGTAGSPPTRDERLRTRSTPLVRKIAAEHGVDIRQVPGTGASGRVTRDDILAFISAGGPEVAPAAPVAPAPAAVPASTAEPTPAAVPAPVPAPDVKTAEPALPETSAPAPATPGTLRIPIHGATLDVRLGSVPIRERDRVEEMSRVRLRTMEHMLMSKRVSAHVTSVTEVDFERVVQLRRSLKPRFADQGVKLTYGPFIYRAVIEALGEYPILNSSVDGSRIVYHGNINLGIAVAINDGRELIVPVLKDADQLSLLGLAQRSNELAEKARNKALDFDDIQGGTFTITNVGVFGNLFGTPIINQPQVAILGTGVIEKRPVVIQDGLGNDVIAIRNRAYFGLSYDHRVVDGAMAAFFLNRVQEYLEGFPDDSA
ncbi:dihydrolipoamide acetyltransferase family protein [Candidatus Palauibacter soopunensis]|uniref:dihydrolipoamide acetyltransferase family protein n=1 Tax=Candidatus Palauibacter soopunensis TaxID=3056739 RepID=UPI0023A14344|nr:dihydrolipoamide acetyltransferase family protein [Candidatus Palauibacter soopunensis]MDE2877496.1 dihydrolipoamide acetyltransferase family protein [Candidatus Palauibacter soopunensis]